MMWLERRRTWRRFSELADRIGARQGRVVRESRWGGLLTVTSLYILTFRPGATDDVMRAQIDAAIAAGFSDPKPSWITPTTVFAARGDLPQLALETFAAETTIRGTDIVVPAGHTALMVVFS